MLLSLAVVEVVVARGLLVVPLVMVVAEVVVVFHKDGLLV
jgi:hypothetical protein